MAIVLFGSQPFTSALVMSNPKMFRYDWYWKKTKATGFFDAKKRPLNDCEIISIFYKKQPTYNPQMTIAEKIYKRGFVKRKKSDCYGEEKDFIQEENGLRYPKRIIEFCNADTSGILHPTQKPVQLLEYLIKTYTNEKVKCDFCGGSGEIESLTIDCDVQTCTKCKGEGVINSVILDNTFGSGTTCIAAKQLKRSFIGMEMDEKYFEIAVKRINEAQPNVSLFSDCL